MGDPPHLARGEELELLRVALARSVISEGIGCTLGDLAVILGHLEHGREEGQAATDYLARQVAGFHKATHVLAADRLQRDVRLL